MGRSPGAYLPALPSPLACRSQSASRSQLLSVPLSQQPTLVFHAPLPSFPLAWSPLWSPLFSFYSIKQRVVPESVNESGVEPYLEGIIELPMAVGTKGGALPTHPGYRYTHALLGNPTARELSELMVAVGLAQVSRICYDRMNHRMN